MPAARLYTEKPPRRKPVRLTWIPYADYANRGDSDMLVWINTL